MTLTPPRPLRLACLNVASFTGKAQYLEKIPQELEIDLLFISETWCAPGQARRYSSWVAHALEHQRKSIHGHVPYGQAILLNPATTSREDLVVLEDDTSSDKSFSIVQFRGVTLICAYLAPSRTVVWYKEKLETCSESCFSEEPVILLGDLNARHLEFGDRAMNTYGNCLMNSMKEMGMQRMEPLSGRWTFLDGNRRSIPDHVLLNEAAARTSKNPTVMEDLYTGGSEHRLLV